MAETHVKFDRLAMAIMIVFIFADVMPHLLLPSGIIANTRSEAQNLMVEQKH